LSGGAQFVFFCIKAINPFVIESIAASFSIQLHLITRIQINNLVINLPKETKPSGIKQKI